MLANTCWLVPARFLWGKLIPWASTSHSNKRIALWVVVFNGNPQNITTLSTPKDPHQHSNLSDVRTPDRTTSQRGADLPPRLDSTRGSTFDSTASAQHSLGAEAKSGVRQPRVSGFGSLVMPCLKFFVLLDSPETSPKKRLRREKKNNTKKHVRQNRK